MSERAARERRANRHTSSYHGLKSGGGGGAATHSLTHSLTGAKCEQTFSILAGLSPSLSLILSLFWSKAEAPNGKRQAKRIEEGTRLACLCLISKSVSPRRKRVPTDCLFLSFSFHPSIFPSILPSHAIERERDGERRRRNQEERKSSFLPRRRSLNRHSRRIPYQPHTHDPECNRGHRV